MLMAVDLGIEVLDRIVQMERDQSLDADIFVEFAESIFVSFRSANIVARRECMFGIEAYPEPIVIPDRVDDPPHLLKIAAERTALARGDFQRDLHLEALAGGVRLVDRLRDRLDSILLAGAHMRAWMRDQRRQPERFASLQLFDEALDRFFSHLFVRRAEIYEIRIVGDHGGDSSFDFIAFESIDFFLRERLG